MGIFSGLFKSRDKPQNRTSGSNYAFFFGGTTSGKAVTERSAMQMTAVYSCVRILSEAVAGLPLHLYKYTDSGGKAMALDHPLYRLLHDEPNPEMSSFVFRETLMTHLLLWGNAYAQIIRNGKGEVVALYPLMPNRMEVNRDKNGKLYYLYFTQPDDAPTMKGSTVYLDPAEVLHIPGLGFDWSGRLQPHRYGEERHRHGDRLRGVRREVLRQWCCSGRCVGTPRHDQRSAACAGRAGSPPSAAAAMRTKLPCWKKA